MTLRAILWRVVPWTVAIGALGVSIVLDHAWTRHGEHSAAALMVFGFSVLTAVGVIVAGAVIADDPCQDRATSFGNLAWFATWGCIAVVFGTAVVVAVVQIAMWPSLAITAAIGGGVILATAAACAALYVGTSRKPKLLSREERERLEREVLA